MDEAKDNMQLDPYIDKSEVKLVDRDVVEVDEVDPEPDDAQLTFAVVDVVDGADGT